MRLSSRLLAKKKVETHSGITLGRVLEYEIDLDSFLIVRLVVRARGLQTDEYRISPSQIIRIEEKRIVVDDAVITEKKSLLVQNSSSRPVSVSPRQTS